MVAERAQHSATKENMQIEKNSILRKHLYQFDNTCAANAHNATNKENTLQKFARQTNTEISCKYSQRKTNTGTCCKYSQLNQIQKLTASTHNSTKYKTHCKYSQHNQIHTANTHNSTKYKTHCKFSQHNQIHTANTHNSTKFKNPLQILTTQPNTEIRCKLTMQPNITMAANNGNAAKYKHATNTHNTNQM